MPDRLSHYVLLERLGTGGMGTVYRARDDIDGREVAVKVLHPYLAHDDEYVRRFEREARIAQSIDAPEVVRLIGDGREDGTYFLVMELVPGETLAEVIHKRGRLPIDEAVGIATSIARAMNAAHQRGIVHRDISPQNVMITPEGQAKVMDFGVSRDLTQASMTSTGMLMGKPHYIAPELVTGDSRPDIRSDIYALGVVLFEMLTGSVPFTAPTPYAVMQKHVTEAPTEVSRLRPDTPRWLTEITEQCLEKDPSVRFQTPEAVRKALSEPEDTVLVRRPTTSDQNETVRVATLRRPLDLEYMTSEQSPHAPYQSPYSPPREQQRRWTPLHVGISGISLLVVLGALLWALRSKPSSPVKPTLIPAPAPLLKATWISPQEGQFLSTGAFTFQGQLEPPTLASTVDRLDLKVFWSNTWVTACYATPEPSGLFECAADVRAAEGPVALSYDVLFKDGTVKFGAAGQRTVARPSAQPQLRPQPTPVPQPLQPSQPDRFDCNAIRGTSYRSDTERNWFLTNCSPPTSVPTQPTLVPPSSTPAQPQVTSPRPGTYQINRVLGTDSGVELSLTTIIYEAGGRMTANFIQRNTGSVYGTAVLACLASTPPETGSQQGATISGVDGYCKQHPSEQFSLGTGQSKAQFSIFQTSGLDANKPITLDISGHTASNIYLR